MPLIVTGSIGIDSVEAPTGSADEVLGGSSVYFGAAASFFGPVRVVGAVGDDFPDHFMEAFHHFQMDTHGVEKRPGSKTFRWRGKYLDDMNQRETLDVQLNVLAEDLPPVPDHYRDSRHVFLANTHPAAQLQLLEHFPERALAVADTMDLWIQNERDALLGLLKHVDGLVLNDSEARLFTGKNNLFDAAEEIAAQGPKFVVVKLGENGSLFVHPDGRAILPAYPSADVVDPTGAGDSFAGGMMGYLAATQDYSFAGIRRAMAYGTVVASFNIESFSLDRLRQIDRDHIDQRFKEYCAMLQIE